MAQDDGYWATLASRARVTPNEIKDGIDLVWLVERYGVPLSPIDTGKWIGHCPFHPDNDPSFEVYEYQGEDKVGCWSCDFGKVNDHFDFIAAMHGGIPFVEAKEVALTLVEESPERRRTAMVARDPKVDFNQMATSGTERVRQDATPLQTFLLDKGMPIEVDWLVDNFRVGLTETDHLILAPHMDRSLDVRGIKIRRDGGFTSLYGSSLDVLYGVWRARGKRRVVLVEGETDTWTVSWLLRDEDVDVLGIPSGITSHPKPEWVQYLKDKEVTLLFDADRAGRDAARKWRSLLGTVRYVRLREGEDATSVPTGELLRGIMEAAETGQEWPTYLQVASSGGLMKLKGDDDPAVVADFHLRPTSVTRLEEGQGHVFDVALPDGREVQITSEDLSSDSRVRSWANGWGYTWVGTTRDAQELLRWLHHESMFKPNLSGTHVVGLHEQTFVLPDETLGAPGWRYVAGPMSLFSSGAGMLDFEYAEWDSAIPNLLASLHRPDVITPILGWTAASFLRPLVSQFPILAVVGGAGLGKTTLVRVVTTTFGSRVASTLTATTPHAVTAFLTATNSVPVWFDEYRLGARDDSKKVFEQSLRDAWEGSSSFKGGLKLNLQEVTRIPVSAPIVVTGEDAFEETSHIERMCMVRLPRDGRNPSALTGLYDVGVAGFARSWVSWVLALANGGELEAPPRLNDRPSQARAVARWGYSLLAEFTQQTCGYGLPDYDDSLVASAHDQSARRPLIVQALRSLEGRRGKQGRIVWRDDDGKAINVRVYDFVAECVQIGIPLAGGPAAVVNELEQRYYVERHDDPQGEYLRVVGVE